MFSITDASDLTESRRDGSMVPMMSKWFHFVDKARFGNAYVQRYFWATMLLRNLHI